MPKPDGRATMGELLSLKAELEGKIKEFPDMSWALKPMIDSLSGIIDNRNANKKAMAQ